MTLVYRDALRTSINSNLPQNLKFYGSIIENFKEIVEASKKYFTIFYQNFTEISRN